MKAMIASDGIPLLSGETCDNIPVVSLFVQFVTIPPHITKNTKNIKILFMSKNYLII